MSTLTRHVPGFGYIVERKGKRLAERRFDRADASSITRARNEAEAITADLIENPAKLALFQ